MCRENKGADQLCTELLHADLRLCFRIGKKPVPSVSQVVYLHYTTVYCACFSVLLVAFRSG